MDADLQYAYLVGNLIVFTVWFIFFFLRKDLHKQMLTMSFLTAPLGPLSELFYHRDYWQPELFNGWLMGLEDLLFAFLIGGIAAVVYEVVFGKKYTKRHLPNRTCFMLVICFLGVLLMVIGTSILKINSIYTSSIAFIILGMTMLIFRLDLAKDAFFSGLLVGGTMFVCYLLFLSLYPTVIQEWWMLDNFSAILVCGVPLQELMWGFGWGFLAGPAYEFINGLRFRKG